MSKGVLMFPSEITKKGYHEQQSGRIYQCRICGSMGPWEEGKWTWRYIFHYGDRTHGDPGWEELIVTCSPECKRKADETIKWRQR